MIIDLKQNKPLPSFGGQGDIVQKLQNKVESLVTISKIFKEKYSSSNDISSTIGEDLSKLGEDVIKFIDTCFKGGPKNNFISDFNIQTFYNYLDSLTLFEEASLLNILIYIILLCSIINIIAIFFGNEIIRYLNLENKFPKLSFFFKLRAKFQRYYFLWNSLIIVFVCIFGICLNLLVFI